jgi:hypothetical protein
MRVATVLTLAIVLAFQPGPALAAQQHIIDDPCVKSTSGTYFWLGGPLSGWYIHNGSGINGCHLYNWTEGRALPVNWAVYALPVNANFNGQYDIWQYVACHHNAPSYKYYIYSAGTAAGVQAIVTTGTHLLPCDTSVKVISKGIHYCATCGASIRLVDNVPVAAEPQNADWFLYNP